MDSTQYKPITIEDREDGSKAVLSRKSLLRQMLVCSGTWVIYFLCGLGIGTPTVLIPQLRREANSTEAASEEMASWLSSVFGYSALPWVIIICVLTKYIGRKITFAMVCLNTLAFYSVLYFSTNTTHILISGIMQGMNHAADMTITIIVVSEYASPKYRGIFLTIKSACLFWGIWVANAVGTFFYWKNIALLGIILSFHFITLVFWPESPQCLASRGRFDECRSAHRWLRGCDEESEKELQFLIKSQQDYLEGCKKNKIRANYVSDFIKTISCKSFYKPLFLSFVLTMQYQLSGKTVCVVYAIDIIKKITNSESTAYIGMLVLDGVTVVGMYIGCFMTRYLKRRTLLFTTSTIGITFLFVLSIYLYLIKAKVIEENNIISITILTLFSVCISCGPMIMCSSVYAEFTPLRYRSSSMMIVTLIFVIMTSTVLKFSPYLFKVLNVYGAFLFYAIASTICLVILYIFLPETKDKTLQEIEAIFNDCPKSADEGTQLVTAGK